jgi:transposase InsO family protein
MTVIYAKWLQDRDARLKEVLGRLRTHQLKLQPDKCEFLRKEVNYLGHQITEDGVRPDPQKVAAIAKFPTPNTVKQLKSFCGMVSYYRRFIPGCSKIASPLYKLLKKGAKFEWSREQEHAFERLKAKLTDQPILQYPDFDKEFILTTDASNTGLGAVLSQGLQGRDLPIAYASRSLNKAEINYSTSEKELLAIVWATKYFRPYLYGRRFKVVTDHKPLTWVMNVRDPGSRLLRWRLQLEEFDYEIEYKKGSLNTNADALSRINIVAKERESSEVLDEESKRQILYEFHDAPVGGHRGMNRTLRAIKARYTWPNMRQEIERYVKQCKSCQVNKTLGSRQKVPMEITSTAVYPFDKCYLDIVGPLPLSTAGNKYILTFQDDLSKYVVATPIGQQDAVTVAKTFVTQIVLRYGAPNVIQTDQGANFVSELFQNTCKLLKIKKIQSTAFHPESQGSIERNHRVLAEYLRHYVREDQTDWDEWVPYATFAYNTSEHSATGYTPFELLFGHPPSLPSALKADPSPQYNYDDYVAELKGRLQTAHRVAKENLVESKRRSKDYYDQGTEALSIKVGDKVLLYDETVRRGRSKKLSSQWIGPYEVMDIDRVNATIKRGRKLNKVHVNRLKPFY